MSQSNEPQPKPSRFVINLDEPPPKPSRKFMRDQKPPARAVYSSPNTSAARKPGGRWKKILLGVFLVFIMAAGALAVGGYFYWQNYKQRPAYSLALTVNAAQRNDKAEFERLVDTDKIVENFVPQIAEQAGAGVGLGIALSPDLIRRQLDKYAPQLLPQIKEQTRAQVEAGVKEFSAKAGNYPFWLVALGASRLTEITENGDTAKVKLSFRNRPLELTMQRADNQQWRIVGIKDDALAREIGQQLIAKLPALINGEKGGDKKNPSPGGTLEDEIRKRLPTGTRDKLPVPLPLP